jgi:hypothetical protein
MKKFRDLSEAIKDKFDIGEYDQEGDMAKSDLRSIIANAQKMHDMLDDADNLPEWVQSKITKAEDYISTVANYMTAEMNEEWSKTGKEATHRETGEKTYEYHEVDKEGKPTGKREYRNAQGKSMGEEVEQIDEISSDMVKRARDAAFAKGKDDQGHRFVRKAYEKGQKESDAMAKKINEVSNELLQRYKKKAGEQIDNPATPSATKLKRGMGHLQATSKQMTSGKPMPKEEVEQIEELSTDTLNKYKTKATAVARSSLANARYGDPDDIDARNKSSETYDKRMKGLKAASARLKEEQDYNVKVSHKTADGEVAHKIYKVVKAQDHRHAQNIALNKHTAALDKAGTKFTGATASVVREDVESLEEKNVPTSPEKWAQAKAQAKAKFDVYPSAYANGWAAKKYKEMGGGWKSVSEEKKDDLPFTPDAPKKKSVVVGKKPEGYSVARHLARQAMQKQIDKMKKPIKEEESKKAKIVKDVMKKKKSSEDAFQDEPVLSTTITKQM